MRSLICVPFTRRLPRLRRERGTPRLGRGQVLHRVTPTSLRSRGSWAGWTPWVCSAPWQHGPFSSVIFAFPLQVRAVEHVVTLTLRTSAQDLKHSCLFRLGSGGCQPGAGFRIANLMEEVTQRGKEIIKTALWRLLREAVTLKIHIDKIAEAGTFCAAFITRVDPRCQGGGGPSTCHGRSWAWRGDANSWGPAGVGVGVKEGKPTFGKKPGVFSPGGQHHPPAAGLFPHPEGQGEGHWFFWGGRW
ncbi:unnamed protein product [Rangifer tarandus platyrhynchus]|uniref:Uncharacterized protein n=1 Tax=Rangifer tarandus platyrhynchus TaxID=3082113 RepID=A0ABN8YW67_RANTA|nr:unnamed protein product [Rangifer tarandus platyrhynchus]